MIPVIGGTTDDRRLLRLAGLALPAAVWVLGVFSPPRGGLSPEYLATFSALLAALVVVDQTAPREDAGPWRRLLWLGAELALCWLVVRLHGTLIRPALIYLLPASRALLMFRRRGLALGLLVWLAYGLNVGLDAWPDRLGEYFPNYFSFFLAPYVVAVVLTLAPLRQVADRLAREMHDSLAHYLTVINVQLEAAETLGPAKPRALECLREVRRSVAALRAATLEELSLPRAVDKLAREFAESTGIAVELRLAAPDDVRLAPEAAQALYRVAQERLTNVQRHARAATVCLSLAAHNGGVELAVQDDGVGPSAESGHATDGFGLLGLRERVELLGGRLSFGRAPSGGSRLAASVPADGGR